jgi:hypothetical protein
MERLKNWVIATMTLVICSFALSLTGAGHAIASAIQAVVFTDHTGKLVGNDVQVTNSIAVNDARDAVVIYAAAPESFGIINMPTDDFVNAATGNVYSLPAKTTLVIDSMSMGFELAHGDVITSAVLNDLHTGMSLFLDPRFVGSDPERTKDYYVLHTTERAYVFGFSTGNAIEFSLTTTGNTSSSNGGTLTIFGHHAQTVPYVANPPD